MSRGAVALEVLLEDRLRDEEDEGDVEKVVDMGINLERSSVLGLRWLK